MLDFVLEDRGNLTNLLVGQSLGIPYTEFSQEVMLVRCDKGSHNCKPTKVGTISNLIRPNQRKILPPVFLYNLIAKETSVFLSPFTLKQDLARSIDRIGSLR